MLFDHFIIACVYDLQGIMILLFDCKPPVSCVPVIFNKRIKIANVAAIIDLLRHLRIQNSEIVIVIYRFPHAILVIGRRIVKPVRAYIIFTGYDLLSDLFNTL